MYMLLYQELQASGEWLQKKREFDTFSEARLATEDVYKNLWTRRILFSINGVTELRLKW